mgnify:CR=1 FL=1
MIKSIHKLMVPKREEDYRALVTFFDALGLKRGEAWEGRRSKGVKLDAPEAGIELGLARVFRIATSSSSATTPMLFTPRRSGTA